MRGLSQWLLAFAENGNEIEKVTTQYGSGSEK
jgi:hypothetical protein